MNTAGANTVCLLSPALREETPLHFTHNFKAYSLFQEWPLRIFTQDVSLLKSIIKACQTLCDSLIYYSSVGINHSPGPKFNISCRKACKIFRIHYSEVCKSHRHKLGNTLDILACHWVVAGHLAECGNGTGLLLRQEQAASHTSTSPPAHGVLAILKPWLSHMLPAPMTLQGYFFMKKEEEDKR